MQELNSKQKEDSKEAEGRVKQYEKQSEKVKNNREVEDINK